MNRENGVNYNMAFACVLRFGRFKRKHKYIKARKQQDNAIKSVMDWLYLIKIILEICLVWPAEFGRKAWRRFLFKFVLEELEGLNPHDVLPRQIHPSQD